MGLLERDYMKRPLPDDEPPSPKSVWVVAIILFVIIAFILSSIL